jgi:hypothetical protein
MLDRRGKTEEAMLYSDIYVKEPLDKIAEDWDFIDEKIVRKFAGFRPVGDNIYGIRAVAHETPQGFGEGRKGTTDLVKTRKNFEIGPQGVVEVARTPLTVHVTRAGTPHHTQFMFGYWHINDKDELIVSVPPTDTAPAYILIVMGHPTGKESDRIAWYCERCTNLMVLREYVTGTAGFQGFWPFERQALAEYNGDVRLRTCSECGLVNPLGYSGFMQHDTPEERAARMSW